MPQNTLVAQDLDDPTFEKLMDAYTDISGASNVEVRADHARRVLHVNVNGVCVLRISQIGVFNVEIENEDLTTSTVLK